MFFYEEKINIPTSYDIYIILFIDIINMLINLEKDFLLSKNENDKKKIKNNINNKLLFLKYLFEEPKTNDYLNVEIPINKLGIPVMFNDKNIFDFVNPLILIINIFKENWIKQDIISNWLKNGGLCDLVSDDYLIKKDLIFFSNELDKKLSLIDKSIIKLYKNKLYDLLSLEQKIKLHTFLIFLLIKNNILKKNDLDQIKKYFEMGIDLKLLSDLQINKIYNFIENSILNITNSDIQLINIVEYEKFLNLQNNSLIDYEQKLINYKKRYYEYNLNLLLSRPNFKSDRKTIIDYCEFLKKINYMFTTEQKSKIKTLHIKLNFGGYHKHIFDKNAWNPLFSSDELDTLKTNILDNLNNLCKLVKNNFPLYNISNDIFCNQNKNTKQKFYSDSDSIIKTTNFYCIVLIIVGIINSKLKEYEQDYIIILKGGKALQFILSGMNINIHNNIYFKSNDIDLIVTPIKQNLYDPNKCKNFSLNICLLIKWILNTSNNIYLKENYVTYELGKQYPYVIKLSHKLQKSDSESYNIPYNAIADIDFGKINEIFYNELVYNNKESYFGNLTFIYQNINDFLLEKIYYLNQYIDIFNDSSVNVNVNVNVIAITNNDTRLKDSKRFIKKFSNQLNLASKIICWNENDSLQQIIDKQKEFLLTLIENNKKISIEPAKIIKFVFN